MPAPCRSQVLVACVRCSLGELLTNGNVIDIFHACFRIGHYQPERSKGTTGGAVPSTCASASMLPAATCAWIPTC